MSQGIVSKGNSPYSFSFQIILLGGGCKVSINKFICICAKLDTRDPQSCQDTGDVCGSSTHQTRLIKICPDCFKIQKMCNKAVERKLYALEYFLEEYKMRKIRERAI